MRYISINGLIYILPQSVAQELERHHNACCATCCDEYLADLNNYIKWVEDNYKPVSDWWDNYITIEKEEKILPF